MPQQQEPTVTLYVNEQTLRCIHHIYNNPLHIQTYDNNATIKSFTSICKILGIADLEEIIEIILIQAKHWFNITTGDISVDVPIDIWHTLYEFNNVINP